MTDDLQIGNTLIAARQKNGYSVLDVAHHTKISPKIITALEADDYSVFDSSTYARSYLTLYSEFLHLDSSPWLNAFVPAAFQNHYQEIKVIDEIDEPTQKSGQNNTQKNTSPSPVKGIFQSLVLLAITAGIIYAGNQLMKKFEPSVEVPLTEKKENTPVEQKQETVVASNPEPIKAIPKATPDGSSSIGNITPPPPPEIAPEAPLRAIEVKDEE